MTLPCIRNRILLLFVIILWIGSQPAWSQTSCAQKLELAQNLYNEGNIHLVEETVAECLEEGFSKEEKVEAYKLLSLTFTYLENDAKAEEAVLNLLRFDKEYRVNPDLDPTEFIKLYDLYRTYPIFKVGIKGIVNYNFFQVSETRTIYPYNEANGGIFNSQAGFGGGLDVEIPYKDFLEFVPGLYYTTRSHTYTFDLDMGTVNSQLGTNSYQERQSWIELPVVARYKYMERRILPYAEAGLMLGYLIEDDKSTIKTELTQGAPEEGPPLDFLESRNRVSYGITAGAGMKFDIPMAEIIIGARYNYALNNMVVVNTEPTSQENELLFKYGVLEHNYKMHTFSFFIGYMLKIYKPKKLNE